MVVGPFVGSMSVRQELDEVAAAVREDRRCDRPHRCWRLREGDPGCLEAFVFGAAGAVRTTAAQR